MSAGSSNIDSVGAWLDDVVDGFGFDAAGAEGTFGDEAARAVADDIHTSAEDVQQEPPGKEFPDNEDKYAAAKAKKYGRTGKSFGLRTGQMLSIESLLGDVAVKHDEVVMQYGTGKPPSSSKSGYLSDEDRSITDVEKARYMTRDGAKTIDFYQLGPYAEKAVAEIGADALERYLKGRAGG